MTDKKQDIIEHILERIESTQKKHSSNQNLEPKGAHAHENNVCKASKNGDKCLIEERKSPLEETIITNDDTSEQERGSVLSYRSMLEKVEHCWNNPISCTPYLLVGGLFIAGTMIVSNSFTGLEEPAQHPLEMETQQAIENVHTAASKIAQPIVERLLMKLGHTSTTKEEYYKTSALLGYFLDSQETSTSELDT